MSATCSPKLELKVKDPAIELTATVVGLITDPFGQERLLTRGKPYLVWINPLEPAVAYLAEQTPSGPKYLGTAPVMLPTHQDDRPAVTENLKLRAKVQALERAAILPIAQAAATKKQADDAWNARAIAAAKKALEGANAAPSTPAAGLKSAAFDDEKAELCQRPERQRKGTHPARALQGISMEDLL